MTETGREETITITCQHVTVMTPKLQQPLEHAASTSQGCSFSSQLCPHTQPTGHLGAGQQRATHTKLTSWPGVHCVFVKHVVKRHLFNAFSSDSLTGNLKLREHNWSSRKNTSTVT